MMAGPGVQWIAGYQNQRDIPYSGSVKVTSNKLIGIVGICVKGDYAIVHHAYNI